MSLLFLLSFFFIRHTLDTRPFLFRRFHLFRTTSASSSGLHLSHLIITSDSAIRMEGGGPEEKGRIFIFRPRHRKPYRLYILYICIRIGLEKLSETTGPLCPALSLFRDWPILSLFTTSSTSSIGGDHLASRPPRANIDDETLDSRRASNRYRSGPLSAPTRKVYAGPLSVTPTFPRPFH